MLSNKFRSQKARADKEHCYSGQSSLDFVLPIGPGVYLGIIPRINNPITYGATQVCPYPLKPYFVFMAITDENLISLFL
jgi:hypothetical protein